MYSMSITQNVNIILKERFLTKIIIVTAIGT